MLPSRCILTDAWLAAPSVGPSVVCAALLLWVKLCDLVSRLAATWVVFCSVAVCTRGLLVNGSVESDVSDLI